MGELWQSLKIWSEGDQDRGFFFASIQLGNWGDMSGENWAQKANNDNYYFSVLSTGLC